MNWLIKNDYDVTKSVVHWDGKLLPGNSGDERLPVWITSLIDGNSKLLGAPKLASGRGKAAADTVIQYLIEWKCDSMVIGMCFNTTGANTMVPISGACTLIEKSLRNLLWMACCHHMFEVLLSDAYNVF